MSIEDQRGFAYQAVYRYLGTLVDEVEPGGAGKLPSLRDLSRRLNVSISTVQSAYLLLEAEGKIYSVAKSGYFALKAPHDSAAGKAADVLHNLQLHAHRSDFTVLSRSLQCTDISLESALQRAERTLLRQCPAVVTTLPDPCGDLELRRALAARYTVSPQQFWSADDVYLATDACAVLELLVAALDLRGHAVLVSSPCAWNVLRTLHQAGVQVVELPLCPLGHLNSEQLERLLTQHRVKLVILDSAANTPQGTLMPDDEREAIAKILEYRGIWVLENDLAGELCFAPVRHLRDWLNPQRLLVFASLGGIVGAEASYGYLLSRHFSHALRRLFLLRSFRLPPIRQKAVARMYRSGRIDQHLARQRCCTQARVLELHRQMGEVLTAQLHFAMPLSGATIWARCRFAVDMSQVFQRLLKQRTLIAPGELFSLQGLFRQHMRLGVPPMPATDLRGALLALGEALEQERLQ